MITTEEKPYHTYLCTYEHDGGEFGVDIRAKNLKDAKARIAKLGSLKLLGRLGCRTTKRPDGSTETITFP